MQSTYLYVEIYDKLIHIYAMVIFSFDYNVFFSVIYLYTRCSFCTVNYLPNYVVL